MESQMMNQKMQVEQEIFINAAPQKVWEIMTSPEGIKSWLGPKVYEPRRGGKIEFLVPLPDHQERMFGEVLTFDPPHLFSFTWTQQIIGGETWPSPTRVTLSLSAEGTGTRVTLVHSDFENLPKEIAAQEFQGYVKGWQQRPVLEGLKKLVEDQAV